jgi:hypothetical protein
VSNTASIKKARLVLGFSGTSYSDGQLRDFHLCQIAVAHRKQRSIKCLAVPDGASPQEHPQITVELGDLVCFPLAPASLPSCTFTCTSRQQSPVAQREAFYARGGPKERASGHGIPPFECGG